MRVSIRHISSVTADLSWAGEILVLIIPIDGSENNAEALRQHLPAEERQRCNRFRLNSDRLLFIHAHSWLRIFIGNYLGLLPRDVIFHADVYGKPSVLPEQLGDKKLHFNISHSGSVAAVALSDTVPVGLDIERVRPFAGIKEIVNGEFHPLEKTYWVQTPLELQDEKFFIIWTRKEAYLKAKGCGLSVPLDSFACTPAVSGSAQVREDTPGPAKWQVSTFLPYPGYAGAVAWKERT